MLSIPGNPGSTCDGWSRREFMRVGGAGLFGVALGDVLKLQALAAENASDATEEQTHDPKPGFFRKRGDRCDGNRNLEHGHPAREHFVLMKV